MRIRIKSGNRGPINSVHEVYMKVQDIGSPWYIIPHQEDYHCDDSKIKEEDNILYRHPDATEMNGFEIEERLPDGFTFICSSDCEEVRITNNREAKKLLVKEW